MRHVHCDIGYHSLHVKNIHRGAPCVCYVGYDNKYHGQLTQHYTHKIPGKYQNKTNLRSKITILT